MNLFRSLILQDISYLKGLPPAPEREARIATLRLSLDLYPFFLTDDSSPSTDVADAQRVTSSVTESSPTANSAHIPTGCSQQAESTNRR